MCKQELDVQFNESKKDISNLLGWFECELEKQPDNLNWGHLGSLNEVKKNLIETLAFFSGLDRDMIVDALIESRMAELFEEENKCVLLK